MADIAMCRASLNQCGIVAGWYTDPPTPMAPVGQGPAPGSIVFIHPTKSQADAGIRYPVALPVFASETNDRDDFCYASYTLAGELHYHPLLAGVEYESLAPDMAAFAVEYDREITFAKESWRQNVDLSEIVTLNMLVAMRHTSYGKEDGAAFRQWIVDFLREFAEFHDMIEFHASGLRLNWTYENDFPPLIQ